MAASGATGFFSALLVDELPPVDFVLLSHLHGDHWDREADRGLDRDLLIVTTPARQPAPAAQRISGGWTRDQLRSLWGIQRTAELSSPATQERLLMADVVV